MTEVLIDRGDRMAAKSIPTVEMFGLPIRNVTLKDGLQLVLDALLQSGPSRIMFLYAHGVNVAHSDDEYRLALAGAAHLFADGVGMRVASLMAGTPLRDNVNGTDLYPLLCEALRGTGVRVYYLGSAPGIAQRAADRARCDYPGLAVCGSHHGFLRDPADYDEVVTAIRAARADVVLVGMGVPLQEKWLVHHLHETGARVGVGVGGIFDICAGKIWRPPVWMRRLGLEWLGRLVPGRGEPRRLWKRYLVGNLVFLVRAAGWAWRTRLNRSSLRDGSLFRKRPSPDVGKGE